MTENVGLIIQLPAGSAVERTLQEDPPPSVASGRVVIEPLAADDDGTIEPPEAGRVVLTFLSPESLRREADQVTREIRNAEGGDTPLVVVLEVAEYLREDEIGVLVQAAEEAKRTVLLCVLGST